MTIIFCLVNVKKILLQNAICNVFFKNNIFIVTFSKCSHAPPPLVFNTVSVGILVATRLFDTDLVERGMKILISMPADCIVVLIHLGKLSCEMIEEDSEEDCIHCF